MSKGSKNKEIAEDLFKTESFREWMKNLTGEHN